MAGLLESLLGIPGKAAAAIQEPILESRNALLERLVDDKASKQAARTKQDYQPLLRQLPTTAAAALGPLLTSRDPNVQQQGQAMLAEYQRRNSPAARQDLDNQRLQGQSGRLQNLLAVSQEKRQQQAFPGQMEGQRLQNQMQRQNLQEGRLRIGQLQQAPPPPTDAQIFEQVAGYPLPKDYIPGFNPYKGMPEPMPAPNTESDRKAQVEVAAAEKVSRTVTRFLALADAAGATGTEMVGPLASQLKKAREDVITAWREQAALGTPTGGELERIDDILPDPTNPVRNYYAGLGAAVTGGMGADYLKQAMLAPYVDMLNTTKADLETKYRRNWWVAPMPGANPP